MTDRELMQQALEALNRSDYLGWQLNIPIIKALRERLAQPEQEPVPASDTSHERVDETAKQRHEAQPEQEPVAEVYRAHYGGNARNIGIDSVRQLPGVVLPPPGTKLYKSTPASKPLTDEQWQVIADTLGCFITRSQKDIIEAALGIKE